MKSDSSLFLSPAHFFRRRRADERTIAGAGKHQVDFSRGRTLSSARRPPLLVFRAVLLAVISHPKGLRRRHELPKRRKRENIITIFSSYDSVETFGASLCPFSSLLLHLFLNEKNDGRAAFCSTAKGPRGEAVWQLVPEQQ